MSVLFIGVQNLDSTQTHTTDDKISLEIQHYFVG